MSIIKTYKKFFIACMIVLLCAIGMSLLLNNKKNEPYMDSDGFSVSDVKTTVFFRLAETMPEDHPSSKAMNYFASLVEKESAGKIKIKVYYDKSLGTPKEIIEQMRFGGIAMARVNFLELSDAVTTIEDFLKPQSYMSADELMNRIKLSEKKLVSLCENEKITPLVWFYPDTRCFYSSNLPISRLEDIKKTKVKTTDCLIMNSIMKQLEAEAIGILRSDLYRSLSAGDVQYGESAFCEFICEDYGKYIHNVLLSDYVYLPDAIIINTDCLNTLAPEYIDIIKKCAEMTYDFQHDEMSKFHAYWIKKLEVNPKVEINGKGFE